MSRSTWISAAFLAILCLAPVACADSSLPKGITLFRADVTVLENGTLEVDEEISVNDAAVYYQHGFRRNLPIAPTDRWDTRYAGTYKPDNGIRVKVLEVIEDRKPVKFEQGSGYGYAQLRIGPQDAPLDSGKHHFVIRYMVYSAMIFGGQRDTLYWSSDGQDHDAPIAESIISVRVPEGIPESAIEIEPHVSGIGLSFPQGPETSLDRLDHGNGPIVYRATNVSRRQSLSVAISWPKGYVVRPQFETLQRDGWVFAAPGALFLYYLIVWLGLGREPKPGTMVARYEPPDGMSPAAVRFITSGTTDGRSFVAVIAQLAVRGCLRVERLNGKYKLSRLMSDRATEASLAPEELQTLKLLFEDQPEIELTGAMDERNAAQNGRYVAAIHRELTDRLGGKYFTRHAGYIVLGVLATFAIALPMAITANGRDTTGAFFFTVWVLFCGLMLGMMIEMSFASAWKAVMVSGIGWLKLLPGALACAVFGGAIFALLRNLARGVSLSFSLMVLAFLLINLGWGPLLKRRSALGRQVADEIAGFRQFLAKVEQDKLKRLESAAETPQDLDRMLPYAIALDLHEDWGDRLAQTFMNTTIFAEQ